MKFIKGMTFAPFIRRGELMKKETLESFDSMAQRTCADFVIIVPNGLQDTPQSEKIDFTSDATVGDEELEAFIDYAHSKGLRVALKPTVNCKNGTWRAHISFFDEDVPCEPKWRNWFDSYSEFQCHFAKLAQRKGCEMFIAGCEMVQSEHREAEWRKVISDIRAVYGGLVSYNTDKYQEHNVKWWDAVDVISSSGYYPINDWENQLDRIEKAIKRFGKLFFFAECGCMSVENANLVPNDWSVRGTVDLDGQAEWFKTMFEACGRRGWVGGFAIWDWRGRLYPLENAKNDAGYGIYGKPAEKVVKEYYGNLSIT
ncbi:MAG: 1,4-beta-xylanase [Eubacterium sp.]|nr:1,4-beta-xylanase [Eubacterium sp.]